MQSVGANGHLEIDFAIDRTGSIDPVHAARYKEFGDWIRACYGTPFASSTLTGGASAVTITVPAGQVFDRVMLEEDVTNGHTVAAYDVSYQSQSGASWVRFSSGQPIGSKRIDLGSVTRASAVRFTVLGTFGLTPTVKVSLFKPCE